MELGETIIKTACWNEAPHYDGSYIVSLVYCLPGNSTLCRLAPAPGWLSSQAECLETSHRHPPVCCRPAAR